MHLLEHIAVCPVIHIILSVSDGEIQEEQQVIMMSKQMFPLMVLSRFSSQIFNRGLRKCLSLQKGSLSFQICDLNKQVGVFLFQSAPLLCTAGFMIVVMVEALSKKHLRKTSRAEEF